MNINEVGTIGIGVVSMTDGTGGAAQLTSVYHGPAFETVSFGVQVGKRRWEVDEIYLW